MQKIIKALNLFHISKVNPIIRLLILSDMFVVGAVGMLAPVFAIYIEERIVGGNATVVGIATAVFLVARSTLQIPIAAITDKIKGEKDDYEFMLGFSVLASLIPLLLLVSTAPWHLYFVQLILGVASAFTFPTYMAIFTRHIDKHKEGMEWGVYYTFVDLSSAALAAVGGYIASKWGYNNLIFIMVAFSCVGNMFLFSINNFLAKKDRIVSLI